MKLHVQESETGDTLKIEYCLLEQEEATPEKGITIPIPKEAANRIQKLFDTASDSER